MAFIHPRLQRFMLSSNKSSVFGKLYALRVIKDNLYFLLRYLIQANHKALDGRIDDIGEHGVQRFLRRDRGNGYHVSRVGKSTFKYTADDFYGIFVFLFKEINFLDRSNNIFTISQRAFPGKG